MAILCNQFVGNWPGVTVEKKEGKLKGHKDVIITDLPGIYSLSPYTLEEVVARNYLINEKPDVILNIVDGTNIERNLYLSTQLIELGIPVVMWKAPHGRYNPSALRRHNRHGISDFPASLQNKHGWLPPRRKTSQNIRGNRDPFPGTGG